LLAGRVEGRVFAHVGFDVKDFVFEDEPTA